MGDAAAQVGNAKMKRDQYHQTGTCQGATPVCLNGACVACSPGDHQCSGAQIQACDATGNWATAQACDADEVCNANACVSGCYIQSTYYQPNAVDQ